MELTPRVRSLFIVHLSVVCFTLGSSITWSGIWPYLNVLDPEVTFEEYGFVVAADAAAQVLFSPVFGLVADRLGRIRPVGIVCCIFFISGNLFYSNIPLIPRVVGDMSKPRVWFTLIARFIVGIGTSINAAARLYVSKVTTIDERTTHTAILSMGQSIGLIAGPAMQAAVTPIGEKTIDTDSTFSLDMYTIIGYISASTGLVTMLLFLPGIFVEYDDPTYRVGEKKRLEKKGQLPQASTNGGFRAEEAIKEIDSDSEDMKKEKSEPKVKFGEVEESGEGGFRRRVGSSESQMSAAAARARAARRRRMQMNKQYSKVSLYSGVNLDISEPDPDVPDEIVNQWPDPWATGACIISFFCFFSGLTTVETLMQPISAHQFGWEDQDSLLYVGLFTACSGLLSAFCFAWVGPLSRRVDERVLLIVVGCVPLLLSRLLMLPMSSDTPTFIGNVTQCEAEGYDASDANIDTSAHSAAGGGCPYCWCLEQRQLKLPQFMVASAIGACGFPFSIAIIAATLSKVLGPIRQGFWMGMLTTAGGMARVIGPIAFSRTYRSDGLYLTLGIICGILGLALIINIVTFRRYKVVMDRWTEWENQKAGKEAVEGGGKHEEDTSSSSGRSVSIGSADSIK